jgi:2,4-dienoyl-CoA reductase-like NADH-dependent reductase (Old Yellow Enzyme family)
VHASLDDPLTLRRGSPWRNRLFLAPLTNLQSDPVTGALTETEIDWLAARGRGGFGQVMTAAAFVTPQGRAWRGQLGVHDDSMLPGLERLAEAIRRTGARSSAQLHHAGMRADADLNGVPNRGPWADPTRNTTELSTGEVEGLVEATVAAAVRCERAGLDGVQLHAAHGYLWCQFMDPRSNRREDAYGGSVQNRLRFTLETLRGIREATGPGFEVGVRLTPEGYGAVEIVGTVLADGQVDTLDLSLWDCWMKPRKVDTGRLLIEEFLDLPRHGTRLGVTGKVTDRAGAEWALARGADFVGIGLAGILHHDAAESIMTRPGFTPVELPVSPAHLRTEFVGEPFLDYLRSDFEDIVA